jgi:hypothetical protein
MAEYGNYEIQKDQKEELKEKAKQFGCDISEDQVLFFVAQLEKEFVFNSYLYENGLEFVNERTKKSVSGDFDRLIFSEENKDKDFKEILHSLVTDENGEILWELFDPGSRKKHNLTICGGGENEGADGAAYTDVSKILPPCGSMDYSAKSNPFDKDHWNMAKQAELLKENPEIAKYLAGAAKNKM